MEIISFKVILSTVYVTSTMFYSLKRSNKEKSKIETLSGKVFISGTLRLEPELRKVFTLFYLLDDKKSVKRFS